MLESDINIYCSPDFGHLVHQNARIRIFHFEKPEDGSLVLEALTWIEREWYGDVGLRMLPISSSLATGLVGTAPTLSQ